MTLQEFKAWFEGYTEGKDRPPNVKEWKRIKERVAEIDGTVITRQVFIDRYYPNWPIYTTSPLHVPAMVWLSNSNNTTGMSIQNDTKYSSTVAMYALGQVEATSCVAP